MYAEHADAHLGDDGPPGGGRAGPPHDAPPGYPAQLEGTMELADGTEVRVRPIVPGDAGALGAFHQRLSERTVFLRYFYPHQILSGAEIRGLCSVDYVDRLALVVERGARLIAVGRYDRAPGSTDAEVAFVVADEWQHHGIATALLALLAGAALGHGVTHFTADVLSENQLMLRVFHESGFPIESTASLGTLHLRLALTPDP